MKRLKREILTILESANGEKKLKKIKKEIINSNLDYLESMPENEISESFSKAVDKLVKKEKVELRGKLLSLVNKQENIVRDDSSSVIDIAPSSIEYIEPISKQIQLPFGSTTLLLFYAYCKPIMTRSQQDAAITYCFKNLSENKVTGRLRVAREGYNSTLTGTYEGIRNFTASLKVYDPSTFENIDFKYVDNLPDNQLLKGLKVWPVSEIVTYGFDPDEAPIEETGIHLTPSEFHKALEDPNAVVIDVRNFNETLIGKFTSPVAEVLDPCMRRSTEFPKWVKDNKSKLKGKKVLMYCTGGVRCERASAYIKNQGVDNVYQLEGGIHRYLEAYPQDGGHWIGKNYTFDKRFSHGAEKSDIISNCCYCHSPWERYNANKKCFKCGMEVLLCRECQRAKPSIAKNLLFCPLCK